MIEDLEDRWYAIAEPRALRDGPLAIRRFGERYVLWRRRDGAVAGLPDRCPHRSVALSPGRVVDDCIECPFHGFRFDAAGQCRVIPAQPHDCPSTRYRVRDVPIVREQHGWIWMWRGRQDAPTGDIPFFEQLEGLPRSRGFALEWNAHYSRVIENQLDFTHLPFVHGDTIGRGVAPQMEVACTTTADRIRAWQSSHPEAYAEVLLPNLWILRLADRLVMHMAFAPVDEHRTELLVRAHQGFATWPGLSWLLGVAIDWNNRRVLRQDRSVVESHDPPRFVPGTKEKLVRSDAPITAYRRFVSRERRRLRVLAGEPTLDVAEARLRARTG